MVGDIYSDVRRLGFYTYALNCVRERARSRDYLLRQLSSKRKPHIRFKKMLAEAREVHGDETGVIGSHTVAKDYLAVGTCLDLLTTPANLVAPSNYGRVVLNVHQHSASPSFEDNYLALSTSDRMAYLRQILNIDGDFFLLLLSQFGQKDKASWKEIAELFAVAMIEFLSFWRRRSRSSAMRVMAAKILRDAQKNLVTGRKRKGPSAYIAHRTLSRLSWAIDLGLLRRQAEFYVPTPLLQRLLEIEHFDIRAESEKHDSSPLLFDLDKEFFASALYRELAHIYVSGDCRNARENLSRDEFARMLQDAWDASRSRIAPQAAISTLANTIAIRLLCAQKPIVLEIQDFLSLLKELKSNAKYQSRFWFTLNPRRREGYVMMKRRLAEPAVPEDPRLVLQGHV